jgi:hypothetical protein
MCEASVSSSEIVQANRVCDSKLRASTWKAQADDILKSSIAVMDTHGPIPWTVSVRVFWDSEGECASQSEFMQLSLSQTKLACSKFFPSFPTFFSSLFLKDPEP